MDRKTKINVLLPMKMVGELENLSKTGRRSDFIMKAIRSKLDGEDSFDIDDFSTKNLAAILVNRLQVSPVDGYERLIILTIMEWMNQ